MADDTIQKLTNALLEKDKGAVLPIDLSTCYECGMRGLCGNECPDFGSKCECGEEVAVAKTICRAMMTGEVSQRGKPSLEWHDKDGNPKYYCCGYADQMTDELLPVCRECIDHVSHADEDLKAEWARR